ncbi:MAG: DEAD/DEAH box helicase family protein [Thermaerobacter sp.]|nr:DEAD/DEAH box helicase family protein [Thermaerobacter sp.]
MRYAELKQAYDRLVQENTFLRQELERVRKAIPGSSSLSTADKIHLFRSLFRGREDVYAVRFSNARTGKTGYAPALTRHGLKPPYSPEDLLPLTDQVIYQHFLGRQVIGLYPLLPSEETWLLAVDFDKANWLQDALAYLNVCRSWDVPASLERSRSGHGAHVWIFFDEPVPARLARRLGTQILTAAARHMGRPRLDSYDRFFPSQDTMPQGGFGNLIALPFQGQAVPAGNSVFLQDSGTPDPNQWDYLRKTCRMTLTQVQERLGSEATSEWQDLGLIDPSHYFTTEPSPQTAVGSVASSPPGQKSITLVVGDRIEIPTDGLPHRVLYELVRLAAFPNPEFYRRQRLHFSTWNTPRILSMADDMGEALALPRALQEESLTVLAQHEIRAQIEDRRISGAPITARFTAQLQADQQQAVEALLPHDLGILDAATGFGKTVVAASLIAQRQVNTLVVVPNRELLAQWVAQLSAILAFDEPHRIGQIGGGKQRASGVVDVATVQTVMRDEHRDLLARYGALILDECHHMASPAYEAILRASPSRYRLGLSATPLRRDGHHPIIFMHLGPIRFTYDTKTAVQQSGYAHRVRPRVTTCTLPDGAEGLTIQEIFKHVALDENRNQLIVNDIAESLAKGRYPLVLTQRTQQRDLLAERLTDRRLEVLTLSSQPSARVRSRIRSQLTTPPPPQGRVILATGRLVGEGFDLPRLDTLFLAAPVSWRNALQQYIGRLHRDHAEKNDVIVYDYIDTAIPALARMYRRRAASYRAFGYHLEELP